MDIYKFRGYYPHFVDNIRIGHILRYLDIHACHGLSSFVLDMDIIYIGHIVSYLTFNVCPIFPVYLSSERDWCMFNK